MRCLNNIRKSGSAHGQRDLFHKISPPNLKKQIKQITNPPNKSTDEKHFLLEYLNIAVFLTLGPKDPWRTHRYLFRGHELCKTFKLLHINVNNIF